jgi:FMN reductase
MRQFAADDVWGDLTIREYDVLYTLSKCEQPITLGELNRHVLLSQPAMSRMIDRLVERGLVDRQRVVEDGRSVRLSLTPVGAEAQRHVGRRHGREVADTLSERLSRDDMRELARICGALANQPAAGDAPTRRGRVAQNQEPFTGGRLMNLVVISGGVSDPSTTSVLADQLAQSTRAHARENEVEISTSVIELRGLANEIATGLVSGLKGPKLEAAITKLSDADAVIVASPIYKAGISGLVKSFIDLLDNDLLIAKPVLLAATAGTARHALVVDESLRSLFAYLRAITVPTAVFASSEDWGTTELGERVGRAAGELFALAASGVQSQIREQSWDRYQHELGSNAGQEQEIQLDSDLMRLAAGGSAL